jgi:hypothetical protein
MWRPSDLIMASICKSLTQVGRQLGVWVTASESTRRKSAVNNWVITHRLTSSADKKLQRGFAPLKDIEASGVCQLGGRRGGLRFRGVNCSKLVEVPWSPLPLAVCLKGRLRTLRIPQHPEQRIEEMATHTPAFSISNQNTFLPLRAAWPFRSVSGF